MEHSRRKLVATAAALTALGLMSGSALAQQKPPVKLGLITPLTGPLASYGKIQEIVIRLAVEDVNAAGGVNGSPLHVEVADSSTDPGQAVLLFRKFAGEGYMGVIGPMTGTQWETVSPLANQIQMPALSVNATKPGVTARPWSLRLEPADDTLMPEGVRDFLKAYPNVKKVVIVADVREASSKAAADAYAELARKAGLQVLDTVEFSSRATDLSAAAIQVKSRNPDAILAAAFPAQAMLLAKEFGTQGIKAPVLNTSILWSGPFINMVGELGRNWHVIGWSTNESTGPGGRQDVYAALTKRVLARADPQIGVPPNMANWAVGYDGVLLYVDIMRRNGIDGNTDPKKARETIKNEFVKLKSFTGAYKYTMRDTGDGHIPATVLAADVDKKQWKFLQPAGR